MTKYFLAKTDPDTYSITDFANEKITTWDGVNNYQAINTIKTWQIGDRVIIYHSMGQARIVGLAKVVTLPILDTNNLRTKSYKANLQLLSVFSQSQQITLKQIKESQLFPDFALIKQSRLSVMPCPDNFILWLKENFALQLDFHKA